MHQNVLPGVTRPEEGEELRPDPSFSPPQPYDAYDSANGPQLQAGSRRFYTPSEMESLRARRRYEEYLDEQDSSKLPNAFDLGPRRNLLHLMGHNPWLWVLPVCNTTGDGWSWEANPKWVDARERIARERWEQAERERIAGWGGGGADDDDDSMYEAAGPMGGRRVQGGAGRHYGNSSSGVRPFPGGRRKPSKADRVLGRDPNLYVDGGSGQQGEAVSLRRLSPAGRTIEEELEDIDREDWGEEEDDDDDDDDDKPLMNGGMQLQPQQQQKRDEAERRALNVVTNGRWGGGTASQLLRGPGPGPGGSGGTSPVVGAFGNGNGDAHGHDDDGVD